MSEFILMMSLIMMWSYTHTHMHIYTHAHIHTCTYTHMHTCTYAHIHTCSHAHMHTYTHAHMHTRTHATCTYAHYTHAHMHICTHTHIHAGWYKYFCVCQFWRVQENQSSKCVLTYPYWPISACTHPYTHYCQGISSCSVNLHVTTCLHEYTADTDLSLLLTFASSPPFLLLFC